MLMTCLTYGLESLMTCLSKKYYSMKEVEKVHNFETVEVD